MSSSKHQLTRPLQSFGRNASISTHVFQWSVELNGVFRFSHEPSKLNAKRQGEEDFLLHSVKFLRKEVIQPHLPIRLPCYDFTPIICPTFGGWLHKGYLTDFGCYKLSWCDGRCVQDPGTYSPWHADPRLLAIPASWRRVAASNPNWE